MEVLSAVAAQIGQWVDAGLGSGRELLMGGSGSVQVASIVLIAATLGAIGWRAMRHLCRRER